MYGAPTKIFIYLNGVKYTIKEASKQFGVNPRTLRRRLNNKLSECDVVNPERYAYNHARLKNGIKAYMLMMRNFYTKEQRLESYKRLILQMKEQRMKKAA